MDETAGRQIFGRTRGRPKVHQSRTREEGCTPSRESHGKENEEEDEENPVTTDVATVENIALPRVVRRRRVATRIVSTAAEVTVTSRLASPDIADGVPAVSGKIDERC